MYSSMRTIFAFFLIFVVADASAQITIDTTVKNRYDSAYKRLPLDIRKNMERTQNELLKTIYGYADIVSEPFYKDDESFKTGYLAKRLHFQYYFKFAVNKKQHITGGLLLCRQTNKSLTAHCLLAIA